MMVYSSLWHQKGTNAFGPNFVRCPDLQIVEKKLRWAQHKTCQFSLKEINVFCFALFLQSTLESMFCLGCRRVFDYQCLTWQVWVQRNFEKKLIQWCLSCWTRTCFLSSFNFFSFFSFTTTVTLKSKRDPDPPLLEELLQLRGLCFFTFRTWCFTCGGNHLVPSPVSSQRVCTSNLLIEVVPLLPEEPDKKIAWQTEIVMFLIMHCEVSMNTVQTITSAKFSKSAISYKRRIHISRI